jgi:hypothetical protein
MMIRDNIYSIIVSVVSNKESRSQWEMDQQWWLQHIH